MHNARNGGAGRDGGSSREEWAKKARTETTLACATCGRASASTTTRRLQVLRRWKNGSGSRVGGVGLAVHENVLVTMDRAGH